MDYGHAYYELISYAGSLYAIGGHDGSETNIMERYTPGEGWVRVANMPYANHRSAYQLTMEWKTVLFLKVLCSGR